MLKQRNIYAILHMRGWGCKISTGDFIEHELLKLVFSLYFISFVKANAKLVLIEHISRQAVALPATFHPVGGGIKLPPCYLSSYMS